MGRKRNCFLMALLGLLVVATWLPSAALAKPSVAEQFDSLVESAIKRQRIEDPYRNNAVVQSLRIVFAPLVMLSFYFGGIIFVPMGILRLFGVFQLDGVLRYLCIYALLGICFCFFLMG